MRITVYRGAHQIDGCITEIERDFYGIMERQVYISTELEKAKAFAHLFPKRHSLYILPSWVFPMSL
jgi:hypothetical protein